MLSAKFKDWEKRAWRNGVSLAVCALVFVLIAEGITWLFSFGESRVQSHRPDYLVLLIVAFGAGYFNEAIGSVHEHLDDVEQAIKHNTH